jgi:hypothetical protein
MSSMSAKNATHPLLKRDNRDHNRRHERARQGGGVVSQTNPGACSEVTKAAPLIAAQGRQLKAQFALWHLAIAVGVITLAGIDYAVRGHKPSLGAYVSSHEFRGLCGIAAAFFVLFLIRRWGISQYRGQQDVVSAGRPTTDEVMTEPHEKEPHEKEPHEREADEKEPDEDLVICCSGGGIKSASFCLGALHQLDAHGKLDLAKRIVAVSGGGYAAAAYLARYHHLDGRSGGADSKPFGPGTEELSELRRRTNYVASRGRAQFDLVTSLIFGIAVNVVLAYAVISGLAWLTSQHVVLAELVGPEAPENTRWAFRGVEWSDWWRLVIGPLVIAGIALLIFLVRRVRDDTRWALQAARSRQDVLARNPWWIRLSDTVASGWTWISCWFARQYNRWVSPVDLEDEARSAFLVDTPNRLMRIAVVFTAVSAGLPWVAVHLHNASLGRAPTWLSTPVSLATLLTLAGLIRSGLAGLAHPTDAATVRGRAAQVFRRHLAPVLAVAVFAAVVFISGGALTARYITDAAAEGGLGYRHLLLAVGLPVIVWALGSTNLTTIHPYYRDRLAYAFLDHAGSESIKLAALATHPSGAALRSKDRASGAPMMDQGDRTPLPERPQLVLVATANVQEGDLTPTGRGGTPFILGSDVVGLTEPLITGKPCLIPTPSYRTDPEGGLELATAMAVSGAAFAPRAGRESKVIGAYRLLLAFANLRLGVWMRNPHYSLPPLEALPPKSPLGRRIKRRLKSGTWRVNGWLDRPTALAVLAEAFGTMYLRAPYLYVTDGGHYDNSGLVECLRRHPRRVILLDGSGDDEDKFPVVGDAMSTVRMDHGIEVQFDPRRLMRGRNSHPTTSHIHAIATDARDPEWKCDITYIKCVLPEGLPWDLEAYRLRNPDFPATTQRFEMFNEFDFEAYRKLGECLVDRAIEGGDLS